MKIGICLPAYNDDSKMIFSISCLFTRWPAGAEARVLHNQAGWVCNVLFKMTDEHLRWGADFIVVLSNDIGWRSDDIKKLIEHNLPIVGGWACGRCAPFPCHVADYYDKEKDLFRLVSNPHERKGVEKIAANGGEMLVFRKDVFEKIPPPWFFGPEMAGKKQMMTEDYFFAKQTMKYGVDMYVDWDVKLKHAVSGAHTYDGRVVC